MVRGRVVSRGHSTGLHGGGAFVHFSKSRQKKKWRRRGTGQMEFSDGGSVVAGQEQPQLGFDSLSPVNWSVCTLVPR